MKVQMGDKDELDPTRTDYVIPFNVLGLPAVEVLGPPDFRAAITEDLERALQVYKEKTP